MNQLLFIIFKYIQQLSYRQYRVYIEQSEYTQNIMMDQILMQQHNSFQHKLTNINNTNNLLDQLQRKMNSYFTNNNNNNNKYDNNKYGNNNKYNDEQQYENENDRSNKHIIHSEINYGTKDEQNDEQHIPVFRRNSVNGYVRGKDNYRNDKGEQLQFKIYNNNNNDRQFKSKDNNKNNITTQTVIGARTQNNYRPSISQKQVRFNNQRLSKTTSTPIVQTNNNNNDNSDNTNNNNKNVNIKSYENSTNNRKKSQQFKLFSRPKSKQKQVSKNIQQNNKSNTKTNKIKTDNLLSQQQQDDRIVIQIDTKYNKSITKNNNNNMYDRSQNKNKYNNGYSYGKQEYGDKYTQNKYENKNIEQNYQSFGKRNQQNISYISNVANNQYKNRNKLITEMETIQILMKERIATKQRKIKQIQQQIVTQNQERVYLYKINVRLNQQLKFLEHQSATKEAQNNKNMEWRIMKLQQQVQKLKKQINKKKEERKQLRKQQKTLKEGYQTVINNKKNILKSDIQKYMQQQNKTKQNTEMLKGLMKQLDKLKGVVESKIKQSHITVGNKSRKVIKSFKN